MLLFQKRFHAGLVSGAVTLTFRSWSRPHVKTGGRYRCHPIGVLEVTDVQQVAWSKVSEQDAQQAGFPGGRSELGAFLAAKAGSPLAPSLKLFRISLRHGGDGDRVAAAMDASLSPADVTELTQRLARLDAKGQWTYETLALIRRRPRVAASQLARSVGRETLPFKEDVRKLKRLGLTQSFEVGYELSPRGRAFLGKVPRRPAGRAPGALGKARVRSGKAKRAAPRRR